MRGAVEQTVRGQHAVPAGTPDPVVAGVSPTFDVDELDGPLGQQKIVVRGPRSVASRVVAAGDHPAQVHRPCGLAGERVVAGDALRVHAFPSVPDKIVRNEQIRRVAYAKPPRPRQLPEHLAVRGRQPNELLPAGTQHDALVNDQRRIGVPDGGRRAAGGRPPLFFPGGGVQRDNRAAVVIEHVRGREGQREGHNGSGLRLPEAASRVGLQRHNDPGAGLLDPRPRLPGLLVGALRGRARTQHQ